MKRCKYKHVWMLEIRPKFVVSCGVYIHVIELLPCGDVISGCILCHLGRSVSYYDFYTVLYASMQRVLWNIPSLRTQRVELEQTTERERQLKLNAGFPKSNTATRMLLVLGYPCVRHCYFLQTGTLPSFVHAGNELLFSLRKFDPRISS